MKICERAHREKTPTPTYKYCKIATLFDESKMKQKRVPHTRTTRNTLAQNFCLTTVTSNYANNCSRQKLNAHGPISTQTPQQKTHKIRLHFIFCFYRVAAAAAASHLFHFQTAAEHADRLWLQLVDSAVNADRLL